MSVLFCRQILERIEIGLAVPDTSNNHPSITSKLGDPWSTWVPGVLRWVENAAVAAAFWPKTPASPLLVSIYCMVFSWDFLYVVSSIHAWKTIQEPLRITSDDHSLLGQQAETEEDEPRLTGGLRSLHKGLLR
uniref:Uncharacterized protein n=1 Tax=Eucampia antarctica TaxID=49252 RepID=A0A7S2R314_9STRA|mmetsp:Transcript_15623/g.15021  ORF Transcript_15623/g.15021 Transcript_15623/m.15021 type:complete len:133 (+) Transcript_15623:557-955(+)